MRPSPDHTARCAHLGCGALFGLLAGVFTGFSLWGALDDIYQLSLGWIIGIALVSVVVCAGLAFRYGERFWDALCNGFYRERDDP
jgi:hypothetical protein